MKNIYFISDIHLSFFEDEFEQKKKEKLIRFFRFIAEDASDLYLLGDVFDFWFEWYFVIPKYHFEVFYELRKLIEKGVKVHYVTGNHDFYLGDYMHDEIGIDCIDECTDFIVAGKKFFVAHGDGYAKSDGNYRILKKILRHRISNFLFKTFIPPDIGIKIAKLASGSSRKLRKVDRGYWSKQYLEFAEKKLSEGYDFVLLGHLHFPVRENISGKTYINTGDWINYYSYARFDGKELSLENFE